VRTIHTYLWRRLASGYLTVTLSLAALIWLLELLQGLESAQTGAGALVATLWQAARLVPETLIDLLPLMVILAGTMVLGAMQRDHELTIVRGTGQSWRRIAVLAAAPALAVAFMALLFLQVAAPSLQKASKRITGVGASQGGLWSPEHGLWARSESEFLNVRRLEMGRIPSDLVIYRYADDGRLVETINAEQAAVADDGTWRLMQVRIRRLDERGQDRHRQRETLDWKSFITADQFELLVQPPQRLPPTELWRYLAALERNNQANARFSLLFWRRMALPLACLGMALIAVVAAASAPRSSRTALRAAVATGLGLGYQLLVELISFSGLAIGLPASAVALIPPLTLIGVGLWWVSRADSGGNG